MIRNTSRHFQCMVKNCLSKSPLICCRTVSSGESSKQIVYNEVENDDINYRETIAPWIKFGEYEKGLLSHLSTFEILRALFVLNICSYDVVVDRSTQLLSLSKKFGNFAEFAIRKTFYDQFVGGEEVPRMKKVVDLLHRRGLTLMVAPVLEEDVDDEKSSKDVYDANLETLKDLAQMTASMDNSKPLIQLKTSAIMPAKTLEQISSAIQSHWASSHMLSNVVEEIISTNPQSWSFLPGVSKEDKEHFINGIRRSDQLVQLAEKLGVKVLVDAEFYSCKLAISTIALALMAKYNAKEYVIGDTVQGYLKDAENTIKIELDVIGKGIGVNWYGKVVRGAYMDRERFLANRNGMSSPICESYDATSQSYNRCVQTALHYLAEDKSRKSHLLIATHNEKSIRLAVQTLKTLGINNEDDLSSFAQIYGMADYLSTPLVNANYKVYKSTPYGPLTKVVPYLARRASENRSVLKGAREERNMLKKELFSRIF